MFFVFLGSFSLRHIVDSLIFSCPRKIVSLFEEEKYIDMIDGPGVPYNSNLINQFNQTNISNI